jgi:hypothetical protein
MELIKVYSAAGQLEAEMIKSFLEAQGLNVVLNQESIGRTYGLSVGALGMVTVLVPEQQCDDALLLLRAMEEGEFVDDSSPNDLSASNSSQIDANEP